MIDAQTHGVVVVASLAGIVALVLLVVLWSLAWHAGGSDAAHDDSLAALWQIGIVGMLLGGALLLLTVVC